MKKALKVTLFSILGLVVIAGILAWMEFGPLVKGTMSCEKLDDGLYYMEYKGDDGFDELINRGGFVIVDDSKRGKGYGKQMLRLAIDYAQHKLGAKRITLGVFCDNLSAVECYKSVGFRIVAMDSYVIDGGEWKGFEMELVA